MTYVEKLYQDIGDISTYKAIGKAQIENLGYKFSKNFIKVFVDKKDREPKFIIYEMHDEDNNRRTVPFTYLFYTQKKVGLVLKNPFSHYIRLMEGCKDSR